MHIGVRPWHTPRTLRRASRSAPVAALYEVHAYVCVALVHALSAPVDLFPADGNMHGAHVYLLDRILARARVFIDSRSFASNGWPSGRELAPTTRTAPRCTVSGGRTYERSKNTEILAYVSLFTHGVRRLVQSFADFREAVCLRQAIEPAPAAFRLPGVVLVGEA